MTDGLNLQLYDEGAKKWNSLYLPPSTEIDIEENSPVWDTSAGSFSYAFAIPIEPNRHVLGTVDGMRGEAVYDRLYGRRFRLYVCGVLLRSGVVRMDKSVELSDGVVEVELESGQKELGDILDGISAQDVPIERDNIQIGWTCNWETCRVVASVVCKCWRLRHRGGRYKHDTVVFENKDYEAAMQLPKVMVPRGYSKSRPQDFVNTQHPYDPSDPLRYPYCNVRLAHQKYYQDGSSSWQAERGYQAHEPYMFNTAPCFYVAFWLDRLFKAVGIPVTSNAMERHADMLRLAFFHTDCMFDHVECEPNLTGQKELFSPPVDKTAYDNSWWQAAVASGLYSGREGMYIGLPTDGDNKTYPVRLYNPATGLYDGEANYKLGKRWKYRYVYTTRSVRFYPYLCRAMATGRNFPDEDAMSVIEALQDGFGMRFVYDSNGASLAVHFVRDILNSTAVRELRCQVVSVHKEEGDKRGFRMRYAGSSKPETNAITRQEELVSGSDDTTYNYNDYTRERLRTDKTYEDIIVSIGSNDRTFYIDRTTGNGYRVKVDEQAEASAKLNPSLFEVGGYRDVDYGDCSDDDYVEEVSVGFAPAIVNDLNYEAEYDYITAIDSDSNDTDYDPDVDDDDETEDSPSAGGGETFGDYDGIEKSPRLACYVDAELHPTPTSREALPTFTQEVPLDRLQGYRHRRSNSKRWYTPNTRFGFWVWLDEAYDISGGAGNPYDENDAGFTLGFMRGGGNPVTKEWTTADGTVMSMETNASAFASDTLNAYGSPFDYGESVIAEADKPSAALQARERLDDYRWYTPFTDAFSQAVKGYLTSYGEFGSYGLLPYVLSGSRIERDGYVGDDCFFFPVQVVGLRGKYLLMAMPEVYGQLAGTTDTDYLGRLEEAVGRLSYDDDEDAQRAGLTEDEWHVLKLIQTDADTASGWHNLIVSVYPDFAVAMAASSEWFGRCRLLATSKSISDRISLKLKAEKPVGGDERPKDDDGRVDYRNGRPRYYDVDGRYAANRGLFDKFYAEYAYWVVHRRTAHIRATVELAEIAALDYTKKYRIGGYVGFIKSVSYSVGASGLSAVDIQLYYL